MTAIAFIGLGNMGGPMAANLVKAGHRVVGYDLVEKLRQDAAATGVAIAASAREAVAGADVVITMLPAGRHVHRRLGRHSARRASAARLFIDSSTIDVDSARRAHEAAATAGMPSLDAPVSGGVGGATRGHADLHGRRRRRGFRQRPSRCSRRWASASSIAAAPAPDRRRKSATT